MTGTGTTDDLAGTYDRSLEREGKMLQAVAGALLCGLAVVAVAAILLFASPKGANTDVPTGAVPTSVPARHATPATRGPATTVAKPRTTTTVAPTTVPTTTTTPNIVLRTPGTRAPAGTVVTPPPTSPPTTPPGQVQVPYSPPTSAPPDTIAVPVGPSSTPSR